MPPSAETAADVGELFSPSESESLSSLPPIANNEFGSALGFAAAGFFAGGGLSFLLDCAADVPFFFFVAFAFCLLGCLTN